MFHPEILVGAVSPEVGVSNKGGLEKKKLFSSFMRQYLENGTSKVTIND